MSHGTKGRIKTIIILALLPGFLILGYKLKKRTAGDIYTARSIHILTRAVLVTSPAEQKSLRDTFRLIMKKSNHDTIRGQVLKPQTDTGEIIRRNDAIRQALFNKVKALEDSISALHKANTGLLGKTAELEAGLEFIKALKVPRYDAKQSLIDSNSNVVVLPIKKRSGGFLSPQLNYLRVYNSKLGGTINSQPFFDYMERDDERNMFMGQLRSSINLKTASVQYGLGGELKLNRLSMNTVIFFNTKDSPFAHPIFSAGARYDFFRKKFN